MKQARKKEVSKMIHCFYDKNSKEYNVNCKEVSLNDLENLIREKKPFEAQVIDTEENFNTWRDSMEKKRSLDFIANREVLSSSTVYLNDNGKTFKLWVYNLQDREFDW